MIRLSEERNWDEEFEDILDGPNQNPIQFYEDEDAELGPPIAEGVTPEELAAAYEEYRREQERMQEGE
jgi:hypothetical protein